MLCSSGYAQVLRSRSDGKKPAEIREFLFLGGTATAESAQTMQQMGITHILNVAGAVHWCTAGSEVGVHR